jgi:hypothetical protein
VEHNEASENCFMLQSRRATRFDVVVLCCRCHAEPQYAGTRELDRIERNNLPGTPETKLRRARSVRGDLTPSSQSPFHNLLDQRN